VLYSRKASKLDRELEKFMEHTIGRAALGDVRTQGQRGLLRVRPGKIREKFWQRHRIQNALSRNTAFAGHLHAPVQVIEFADGMSIRVDAENAAVIQRPLMPAPVKIKTPGMTAQPGFK
jgi:hypothetical protein